jgi:hypothetical protein
MSPTILFSDSSKVRPRWSTPTATRRRTSWRTGTSACRRATCSR